MSRPWAKVSDRWQSYRKFPLATDVFGQTWPPPWLDFSWLLRVLWIYRRLFRVYIFRWHFARFLPSLLEKFASRRSNEFLGLCGQQSSWGCIFSPSRCICWEGGGGGGGGAEGKFKVFIKPLPFLAQICRCPIHVRPVVRCISVSFRHVYPVCVVFVVRNPTTWTPCYAFTTYTPCWITNRLAGFNVIC